MKMTPAAKAAPTAAHARYIMIGGFLGAGKTTAGGKLARHLTDQGLRVGLITNDQGRNLVRNDFVPELSYQLEEPVQSSQLIINLRAEAAPDLLESTVRAGLSATAQNYSGLSATLEHLEHFRPGKPTPTHRIEMLHA